MCIQYSNVLSQILLIWTITQSLQARNIKQRIEMEQATLMRVRMFRLIKLMDISMFLINLMSTFPNQFGWASIFLLLLFFMTDATIGVLLNLQGVTY